MADQDDVIAGFVDSVLTAMQRYARLMKLGKAIPIRLEAGVGELVCAPRCESHGEFGVIRVDDVDVPTRRRSEGGPAFGGVRQTN